VTPTWTMVSAADEFVRCLYCPALYRAPRKMVRPYVCPVCVMNAEEATRRAKR